MSSGDPVGNAISVVAVGIIIAVLISLLTGCTMTRGDATLSLLQLGPGDDVQSSTTTVVGLEAQPLGSDGPTVRMGYVRSQRSRVPAFDQPAAIPSVKIDTKVAPDGTVTEALQVGEKPPAQGWFSTR